MKFIEKVSLALFSIIVLLLSLIVCLVIFGWLPISTIVYVLQLVLAKPNVVNVILIISVILMLLAIKCIFFSSREKNEKTEGILLENENGKLLISVNTIENLVKGVIAGYKEVTSANCKVQLNKQVNNVKVDLNMTVAAGTVIKDLSVNLQDKIKEVVKQTTELDIKEINIKIKDIEASKKETEK